MNLKPALSIQEQLTLLQNRGMIIDCVHDAEAFLASNNYYRLNIYFHKAMDQQDHYPPGFSFSQIMHICQNDCWFRRAIVPLLESVEIKMRTHIAYFLGRKYGSEAFYRTEIYKNTVIYRNILNGFQRDVERDPGNPVFRHHLSVYSGAFPIWVVVEFFSFNRLSKYFGILLTQDAKIIAKNAYQVNEYLLGQWLHVLSNLRNICAHYGYLFQRLFPVRPIIPLHSGWDRANNANLFAILLVLQELSVTVEWDLFIHNLLGKSLSEPSFKLTDYGFPDNWEQFLFCR